MGAGRISTARFSGAIARAASPASKRICPASSWKNGSSGGFGEQPVDLGQRLGELGLAMVGDCARVARGLARVRGRVETQGRGGLVEEPAQLGLHAGEGQPFPGVRLRLRGRRGVELGAQQRHPLARQRVGEQVGVAVADEQGFPFAQLLEEREQAAGRAAGVGEIGERGLVGRRLLGAAVLQKGALRHLLAAGDGRRAGLAAARADGGGEADQGRDDRLRVGAAQAVVQARQMAARDVADLVRDHSLDLVGMGPLPGAAR